LPPISDMADQAGHVGFVPTPIAVSPDMKYITVLTKGDLPVPGV